MRLFMRKIFILLYLIVSGGGGVWGATLPETLTVKSGIEVIGPDSILCKTVDDPVLGNVRLRVEIRGIERPSDPNVQEAMVHFLKSTLESAKSVRLEGIHYGYGFRLTADIRIEEVLLSKLMTDRGLGLKPAVQSAEVPDFQDLQFRRSRAIPAFSPKPISPTGQKQTIKVGELFKRPVDLRAINDQTTFSEALDILCRSIEPRLPLVILWKDLEINTYIQQDTPVGIGGMTVIPFGYALELILRSAAGNGPKPVLVVEGGVLTLGSAEILQNKSYNKVYPIKDLTNPQSVELDYGNSGNSGPYGGTGAGFEAMGTGR